MPRLLYVLLEGEDDRDFFDRVLKHEFERKYDDVRPYLYVRKRRKIIEKLLKSLNTSGRDYVIFSDFDEDRCITKKKEDVTISIPGADPARIVIVKCEIESWYVAGLSRSDADKLQIPFRANTEIVSKESLERDRVKRFSSRIDFMQEILKHFDVKEAKKQNPSFRYMWQKFIL